MKEGIRRITRQPDNIFGPLSQVPRMEVSEERTTIESLIRRDRLIVSFGLASIAAVALVYLLDLAKKMSGTDMTGIGMMKAAAVPDMLARNLSGFLQTFIMWTVMMVSMMTPSVAPMVFEFAAIRRRRYDQHSVVASVSIFVSGYFLIWTLFSAFATLVQWRLHSAAFLSPAMAVRSRELGGVLFVVSGVFQWTKLKHRCLRSCRSPIGFFLNEWRDGRAGALAMGIKHGGYCLGCCFFLMAILFVAGVMNLVWVGGIAAFVLIEKVFPAGPVIARIAGIAMLAWGTWLIFGGL